METLRFSAKRRFGYLSLQQFIVWYFYLSLGTDHLSELAHWSSISFGPSRNSQRALKRVKFSENSEWIATTKSVARFFIGGVPCKGSLMTIFRILNEFRVFLRQSVRTLRVMFDQKKTRGDGNMKRLCIGQMQMQL